MQKPDRSDTDITKQPYRGPGAVVASLGEGALQTKFMAIAGLIVGGLAAAAFPTRAQAAMEKITTRMDQFHASPNRFLQPIGALGKWLVSIGEHSVTWLRKFESVDKLLRNSGKRAEAAIEGAILTSAGASLIGTFVGGSAGVIHARAGRRQFETAKTEIVSLRDENGMLRNKLVQAKAELEDAKTIGAAHQGTLKVAGDEPKITGSAAETDAAKNWADSIAAEKAAGLSNENSIA